MCRMADSPDFVVVVRSEGCCRYWTGRGKSALFWVGGRIGMTSRGGGVR